MNNSSTKFTIEGFQDDELKITINTFELQVSPDQFDIKFGKVYDAPGKNAEGDKLVKAPQEKKSGSGIFHLSLTILEFYHKCHLVAVQSAAQ